ncbi:hypothetical protein GALMADRAFT_221364 [Galerina marginata CBS 339.88]|uniref:Uncharacterized protein n=1 Tax=Galerina marginata (strain CBS 339.88) TaxID=685588 RepID=A0A067TEF0_GALM3|nr:hypothetical protein GALMADRAFT_221364 [Galerina marginata CBS 339.88]
MTKSLSAARAALQSIKRDQQTLEVQNGISLLSLKHYMLVSYLQSLVLVTAQRVLGNTLTTHSPPDQHFSTKDRDLRGNHLGDLLDSMIENRIVLDKTEVLESKMRYQITKLVRITDTPTQGGITTDDPLAFKPNPMSLLQNHSTFSQEGTTQNTDVGNGIDGDTIYRPPRLAPMPYVERSKTQTRQRRPPVPSALANLAADPSQPFLETTSGLGGAPALASGRAQYLKKLKDFEEDNFTRLVMKKNDAKQRARDEEALALGGDLSTGFGPRGRQAAGGFDDEFSEVLRSVSRVNGGRSQGDGYEELRKRGKKTDAFERSRTKRNAEERDDDQASERRSKRSRFELETKVAKKKVSKR